MLLKNFHPLKVIICLRLIVPAECFCLSATLHVLLINSALLRACFLIFYQLMASGVNGSRGLNARDLAEVEYKHVLARALIPAQLMEEKNVSVAKRRPSHVTAIIVQVYFVKIKSLVLRGMVFFCNYSVSLILLRTTLTRMITSVQHTVTYSVTSGLKPFCVF